MLKVFLPITECLVASCQLISNSKRRLNCYVSQPWHSRGEASNAFRRHTTKHPFRATRYTTIMFGAFRPSAPLYGGLLWYELPPLITPNHPNKNQENPMAPLRSPKTTTPTTITASRQRRRRP